VKRDHIWEKRQWCDDEIKEEKKTIKRTYEMF